MIFQVCAPVADVCSIPDHDAAREKYESQLVFGELFDGEDNGHGWIYGTCLHDGYKGYVDAQHLSADIIEPTHKVVSARSHVYARSTMKSPLVTTLSYGSRVSIIAKTDRYAQLDTGEWTFLKNLAPADAIEPDFAATALLFLETQYYWGGRSGFGIDCSGLVQVSLEAAKIMVPRDTDDQFDKIGEHVPPGLLKRNDIVYFPGHVGIMLDATHIIHANGFHMKTVVEPLSIVAARSEALDGKGVISVRRFN